MRFKGLDLNLLGVFDILMRTRSVSRAAEQLNVSQPAVSSALKRLRDHFGDEILVAQGKRMFPTPHAETLWLQVRHSLQAIEALIATSTKFDPAVSERTFRLCASDYMATAVFAPLSRRLSIEAPRIRLELMLSDEQSQAQLEQGQIDLLVTPEGYTARDMPAEHLLDERHVVVGWAGNPLLPDRLDEAAFMAAGHIQLAIGYHRTLVFSDRELDLQGRRRQIDLIASSFAIVPWLLVGTQRLALMHERLAQAMAPHHPIAIADIPFDFPLMREMVQFHPTRASDPGLSWLRAQLQREAILR